MVDHERFEQALRSQDPHRGLSALVQGLSDQGHSKAAILELFEKFRQDLRSADREQDEDAVADVMDLLLGWCAPHARLLPEQEDPAWK